MKLRTLKSQIQTLGFEEAATMSSQEYRDIIINGINRAMQMIAQEVAPVIGEKDFEPDDATIVRGSVAEYDLRTIPEYEEDYLGVEKVIYKTDSSLSEISFHEEGSTLYLPQISGGYYTVKYRRRPTEITVESTDDEKIDMPAELVNLIAPLAAYYIWLDDDTQKAQMYRNDYEQLKESYIDNRSSFETERVYSIGG